MDAADVRMFEDAVKALPEKDSRANMMPREFTVAVVFGFFRDGDVRSLSNLRMAVIGHLGKTIARSSFWGRLAAKRLGSMLSTLIIHLLQITTTTPLGISADILGALSVLKILILDSTSSSLPDGAASAYPGPRNNSNPAAVKWHALWNLFTGGVEWHDITPATTHDRKGFPPLAKLAGALIIFDLGYWDYQLFADLIEADIFFLSRVRSDAIIDITKVVRGLPKELVGRSIAQITHGKTSVVEFIGAFGSTEKVFTARVIGFWNADSNQFHWYTTNLLVPATLMYPLYRLRWQLELAFKASKTTLRLADFTTTNAQVIRNLILAHIAAVLFAQALGHQVSVDMIPAKQAAISVQRIAKVVVNVAHELVQFLLKRTASTCRLLAEKLELFAPELFDPNYRHRETTLARVVRLMGETCECS